MTLKRNNEGDWRFNTKTRSIMKDSLGDRMKKKYENRTRIFLPRRTYVIIRLDGVAFHTYTKGLDRPFDENFAKDMNLTAKYLCKKIQGAQFAYVQSDEISILLTDFNELDTEAWFDNNLQKLASVSASMASSYFNYMRLQRYFCGNPDNIARENDQTIGEHYVPGTNLEDVSDDISSFINYMPSSPKFAAFDARVFVIPDPIEVHNYFVWRQQDATRNSISMAAQSMFSHGTENSELHGKSSNEMQEMMFQKGVNWNDYPDRFKRGGFVFKETYKELQNRKEALVKGDAPQYSERTRWVTKTPPILTKEPGFTFSKIPVIGGNGTISLQNLVDFTKETVNK